MQGSSEGGMPTCGVLGPYAAAWAVLVEPAASLMAPLLGMEDLFVLSLVSKGLRPIWGQLCHLGPLNNKWIIELLASGDVGPMVRRIRPRAVIGNDGMESLAHELVHVPRLEELDLNNMFIEERGAIPLAAALQQHAFPHLHTLDLSFNFIGANGMSTLAPALFPSAGQSFTVAPPPLRCLQLEGNALGPKGAGALVDAILAAAAPPQVAHLTIAQNRLGNKGAAVVARLFTEWKGEDGCPIEMLDLTTNHIGDAGLHALGTAIFAAQGQRQHRLVYLDLWYNHVRVEGLAAFCRMLEAAVGTPEAAASSSVPLFAEANFEDNHFTYEDRAALRADYPQLIESGLVALVKRGM